MFVQVDAGSFSFVTIWRFEMRFNCIVESRDCIKFGRLLSITLLENAFIKAQGWLSCQSQVVLQWNRYRLGTKRKLRIFDGIFIRMFWFNYRFRKFGFKSNFAKICGVHWTAWSMVLILAVDAAPHQIEGLLAHIVFEPLSLLYYFPGFLHSFGFDTASHNVS